MRSGRGCCGWRARAPDCRLYAEKGTTMIAFSNSLWKSDGTPDGTILVKTFDPLVTPALSDLIDVNGIAFFVADDGVHGRELWKSDGTPVGTVLVKDIHPGEASAFATLTDP